MISDNELNDIMDRLTWDNSEIGYSTVFYPGKEYIIDKQTLQELVNEVMNKRLSETVCPSCDRTGPRPRITQPHMGMCGACGRIPNAT